MKNWIILATTLFNCGILHAGWSPEYLFEEDITVLDNSGFIDLKSRVIQSLAGSWCSDEKATMLMDLIFTIKPEVCLEVGAFTGSSVLPVGVTLKYINKGTLFAIDAWSNAEVTKNLEDNDPNKSWWSTVNMKEVRKLFDSTMRSWSLSSIVRAIEANSEQAAPLVRNIDFLHLDGDYSEKGSLKDLDLYLPKVKSGGYILVSNFLVTINNEQPKVNCFPILFDACDMVAEIDGGNAILFKKL